jgi:hypothetical protein
MIRTNSQELIEILQRVETWPTRKKLELARRLLESVAVADEVEPQEMMRGASSDQVLGIWKPVGPNPNDEEVQRIFEEELVTKYVS